MSAFWRRLDVPGSDAAWAQATVDGHTLAGQAVFLDEQGPAALRYALDLDERWATRSARIDGVVGADPVELHVVRTPDGWALDGHDQGMDDVVDLDLGFTPATNLAQLRRIDLAVGESARFDVAWLEVGQDRLVRLPQEYTRTAERSYAYRSPTLGYEATLVLEPTGFVRHYPELWQHVAEVDPTG